MEKERRNKQGIESLRVRGIALSAQGVSHGEIAHRLGVAERTVRKWCTLYRRAGVEGLRVRGTIGRKERLEAEQKQRLTELLIKGPREAGFDTDRWTCPRVQALIEREFGTHFHVDALPRYLHCLGFSPQKPEGRARGPGETANTTWVHEQIPSYPGSR